MTIKIKQLILENSSITIDDLMEWLSFIEDKWSYSERSMLRTIEQFYYSNDQEEVGYAKQYIELLNQVYNKVLELVKGLNISYINEKEMKNRLIRQEEFKSSIEDYFPFPIYISQKYNTEEEHWGEIGVLIDINGKVIELFEGNDEASPETINFVNNLINPSGKKVKIYAAHNTELVRKIEMTETLPKNLYVSPYKPHAEGYMDLEGNRALFSGIINVNDVSQESELDWKTMGNVKIEKFRWL